MPLTPGSRMGPYTVSALLGAGGMGAVYRAFDERLGRDVAIKVLHEEASADRDLQRRFALEARAVSALNHPNILTVHDVGMENGVPYIVSELIEGEPLRTVMARGAMPVRKVLDVAVQVAAGLAAAHQAGIVHRDLKPANLMLTKDGFAKILDFGLAKTVSKAATAAGAAGEHTSAGVIVGTATYMSPEQVRGDELDQRTDQFSLGLVLYEMVTGKPAFARSSAMGTMAAIAEEPAPPIVELAPTVPTPLRWCIERCLAKDREDRYSSTADLHRELDLIRSRLGELSSATAQALPAKPPAKRRRWFSVFAAALGMLAGGVLVPVSLIPDSMVDLSAYRLTPLATKFPRAGSPAWSADGKSIAYTGDVNGVRQVLVRDLSAAAAGQLTDSPADCRDPFWLPDDSKVLYLSSGSSSGTDLYAVGAAGGAPAMLLPNVVAAAVSPDGKTLAVLRPDPAGKQPLALWTADVTGGSPTQSARTPFTSGQYRGGYLAFSPDGKSLGAWLSRWDGRSEFWILPWPAGDPREPFTMVAGAYPFSWMPDSRRMVFGGAVPGTLGADLQMVDTRTGGMRPLSAEVKDTVEASVAPDGRRIAFSAAESDFDVIQVPLDGSPVRTLLSTSRSEFDPTWSPGGDQIAVSTDRTGTSQIWLRGMRDITDRALITEKDFGAKWVASFSNPVFSPDGRRLAYGVTSSSGHAIYVSNVAGGKPIRLSTEDRDERAATWNADGNWIAFLRNDQGRWALVKAPSGGGSAPTVVADEVLPVNPQWNAKTNAIAVMTRDGLAVVPADGGEPQTVSKANWLVFGWTADGQRLVGVQQVDRSKRVLATLDPVKQVQKILGDLQLPPSDQIRGFSLAPDGLSFATSRSHPTGDLFVLEGFQKPRLFSFVR